MPLLRTSKPHQCLGQPSVLPVQFSVLRVSVQDNMLTPNSPIFESLTPHPVPIKTYAPGPPLASHLSLRGMAPAPHTGPSTLPVVILCAPHPLHHGMLVTDLPRHPALEQTMQQGHRGSPITSIDSRFRSITKGEGGVRGRAGVHLTHILQAAHIGSRAGFTATCTGHET